MLPAFASVDDLAARIPGGISETDEARAQAVLDDSSSKVRSYTGETWATDGELDFPTDPEWAEDTIVRITLAVARRSFENPEGHTQQSESLDGYSYTDQFSNASPDVYLTAAEKADLDKLLGGTSGVWTLATTRCEDDNPDLQVFAGDVYLDVNESELIPFLPVDASNGL